MSMSVHGFSCTPTAGSTGDFYLPIDDVRREFLGHAAAGTARRPAAYNYLLLTGTTLSRLTPVGEPMAGQKAAVAMPALTGPVRIT